MDLNFHKIYRTLSLSFPLPTMYSLNGSHTMFPASRHVIESTFKFFFAYSFGSLVNLRNVLIDLIYLNMHSLDIFILYSIRVLMLNVCLQRIVFHLLQCHIVARCAANSRRVSFIYFLSHCMIFYCLVLFTVLLSVWIVKCMSIAVAVPHTYHRDWCEKCWALRSMLHSKQ